MNPTVTGKAIASLRKKAGLTQAALAEALSVSDKAVSKWERGISCPDIAFLPKLSILLDTDIESLLSGEFLHHNDKWRGILLLDDYARETVYSKPLVYLLLSHFLLVGIREILVINGNIRDLLGTGNQFGIHLIYSEGTIGEALVSHPEFISSGAMVLYQNVLIYGSNLTRKYQSLMSLKKGALSLATDTGKIVPVLFIPGFQWKQLDPKHWNSIECMLSDLHPEIRKFNRGTICLPIADKNQLHDAASLIRILENQLGEKIGDPEEISLNRSLIHPNR